MRNGIGRLFVVGAAVVGLAACGGEANAPGASGSDGGAPTTGGSGGASGNASGGASGGGGSGGGTSGGTTNGGGTSDGKVGAGGTGATGGLAASCAGRLAQPRDATWTLTVGGMTRTANVHVPQSYDPSKPTPVVFNFHGFTSDAAQEDLLAGMSAKADVAGFIAVHPEGTGNPKSWNAGACCGDAVSKNTDDIGFIKALLDQAEQTLCVDTKRVFATGMSNGGFLSHRIGCELADRFAAVAPVAGVLGMQQCNPSRPMPVIHFHGTLDPLVPYDGSPLLGFHSVPDTFAGWAQRNGCTDAQPVEVYRNMDSHCAQYSRCAGGVEVTLCTVDGGGHTWPGGLPIPAGYTTPFLKATDMMWEFFQRHPLP